MGYDIKLLLCNVSLLPIRKLYMFVCKFGVGSRVFRFHQSQWYPNCVHSLMLLHYKLFTHSLSPSLPHLYHLPLPLPSGNRVALVQAALARQLDNEDEGNPMSFRRPTASQPEPVISPSISFTDENGLTNSSSQGSTSSGHLPVSM
jgi:hypothetical protein